MAIPISPKYRFRKSQGQWRRRLERERLEAQGWRSTGDLPYDIADVAAVTANGVAGRMSRHLNEALAAETSEYADTNVRKISGRRYVSPGLAKKITNLVKARYGEKPYRVGRAS